MTFIGHILRYEFGPGLSIRFRVTRPWATKYLPEPFTRQSTGHIKSTIVFHQNDIELLNNKTSINLAQS